MSRLRSGLWTLGVPPPGADADRTERLRFVRDLNARCAIGVAGLLILAVAVGAGWAIAVAGIALLVVLIDVAWLSYTVRRDSGASP